METHPKVHSFVPAAATAGLVALALFTAAACSKGGPLAPDAPATAARPIVAAPNAGATTQLKPGPPYNATGNWFINVNFPTGFHGEGCLALVQDAKGDITTDDGSRAYTFKQQGSGRKDINSYKLSIVDYTGDACDARTESGVNLSGTVELNTVTNQFSGVLSGAFLCQQVTATMTLTKGCA